MGQDMGDGAKDGARDGGKEGVREDEQLSTVHLLSLLPSYSLWLSKMFLTAVQIEHLRQISADAPQSWKSHILVL